MFTLLPLLLAGAASVTPYRAIGDRPAWQLTIDRDTIRLAFGRAGASRGHVYRDATARAAADGARRWQAGTGVAVISVHARPGRCRAGDGVYADVVRVRLSGRELAGCGGAKVRGGSR